MDDFKLRMTKKSSHPCLNEKGLPKKKLRKKKARVLEPLRHNSLIKD